MVMQTPLSFGSLTVLENALVGAMYGTGHGVVGEQEASRRRSSPSRSSGSRDVPETGQEPQPPSAAVPRAREGARRAPARAPARRGHGRSRRDGARRVRRHRPACRDELGTTIMWVEHVMSAVIQLAERAIVLNFGEVLTEAPPEDVIANRRRRRLPRTGRCCLRCRARRRLLGREGRLGHRHRGLRGGGGRDRRLERRRRVDAPPGARRSTLRRWRAGAPRGPGPDTSPRPSHRRAGIAYVPAERHLFPSMTVKTNLALGAYPGPTAAPRARLDLFPVSPSVSASGRHAERRGAADARVGRALMSRPRVLMLDEPTTVSRRSSRGAVRAPEGLKATG